MNCAGYEQGLARLMGDEATGADRPRLLEQLRRHAAICDSCRGSADLVDLLALPAGERDIVDDPGDEYWSSFEARLRPRLEAVPERSHGRWWAVAAAVLLLGLLAGWMLRGPGETEMPAVMADAGTGRTSEEVAHPEFPPSLVQSLDRASAEEVESQLAAFEELGPGWGADWPGAGEADWGGVLYPEVERLDVETREKLLEWLRDQNRGLEGAQG